MPFSCQKNPNHEIWHKSYPCRQKGVYLLSRNVLPKVLVVFNSLFLCIWSFLLVVLTSDMQLLSKWFHVDKWMYSTEKAVAFVTTHVLSPLTSAASVSGVIYMTVVGLDRVQVGC